MITIQIINKLTDNWIDPDCEHELTDQGYIELIHEDIGWFLEGAYFRVIRDDDPPGDWHEVAFEPVPGKEWHQVVAHPGGNPVWLERDKEE